MSDDTTAAIQALLEQGCHDKTDKTDKTDRKQAGLSNGKWSATKAEVFSVKSVLSEGGEGHTPGPARCALDRPGSCSAVRHRPSRRLRLARGDPGAQWRPDPRGDRGWRAGRDRRGGGPRPHPPAEAPAGHPDRRAVALAGTAGPRNKPAPSAARPPWSRWKASPAPTRPAWRGRRTSTPTGCYSAHPAAWWIFAPTPCDPPGARIF